MAFFPATDTDEVIGAGLEPKIVHADQQMIVHQELRLDADLLLEGTLILEA